MILPIPSYLTWHASSIPYYLILLGCIAFALRSRSASSKVLLAAQLVHLCCGLFIQGIAYTVANQYLTTKVAGGLASGAGHVSTAAVFTFAAAFLVLAVCYPKKVVAKEEKTEKRSPAETSEIEVI